MRKLEYTVTFNTPAFLGNAGQSGQWRTPPFKALLRQWWRVAYAADHGFNVNVTEMRREEGLLFGNAWLSHQEHGRTVADFSRSLVRLRLDRWDPGKLKNWNRLEQPPVFHPELQRTRYQVGPHAYLGFGPLDGRDNTKLSKKVNAAIQAGEYAKLSIAFPNRHVDPEKSRILVNNASRIEKAFGFMDRYGTLGGRSRNGWGSFTLLPSPASGRRAGEEGAMLAKQPPLRPWKDCLDLDWPHAIGRVDDRPLIWHTANAYEDWKTLMHDLAIIKIGLRVQHIFSFNAANGDRQTQRGINHGRPQARHWLAFPVTNHSVSMWGGNARLPNSLRFKVRPDDADPKKLRGVIFHMPCLPPAQFHPDRAAIETVWQSVYALLDDLSRPKGSRRYARFAGWNQDRKNAMQGQLDGVLLERIPQ